MSYSTASAARQSLRIRALAGLPQRQIEADGVRWFALIENRS